MKDFRMLLFCVIFGVVSFSITPVKDVYASDGNQEDIQCAALTDELTIPEDGNWLRICLTDPSAPDESVVTEISLKVILKHADPSQLEILLSRNDSDYSMPLSNSSFSEEGIGLFSQIHEFDGSPSQVLWVIQIRDTVLDSPGNIADVSIALMYAPTGKLPIAIKENNGKPTSIKLPVRTTSNSDHDDTGEKSSYHNPDKLDLEFDYSVSIMSQNFESIFPLPSSGWDIYDDNPDDQKEYFWDDDELRHYNGLWAAWPANGGVDGIEPTSTTNYPKNMDSIMVYGPYDLSNAKSAQVSFMLWRDIEINYDIFFFGSSNDGSIFNGYNWDGNVDWENITFSLDDLIGESNVWILWRFASDSSIEKAGPWIDDVTVNFEPGDVSVEGNFAYADRTQTMRGAKGVRVQLWDQDASSGDDLLAEISADGNGNYSFPSLMNWDTDEAEVVLTNNRLDLYLLWVLQNEHFKVANSGGNRYAWISPVNINTSMGNKTISAALPYGWTKLEAMWFYQDIRRTWEFYLNHTVPPTDTGFLTAHWDEDQNSQNAIQGSHFWALINPHAFIAHDSRISSDTVVHELGHHIMWNKTGQWLWYDFGCFTHYMFSQESHECGWSEGWADFFAIAVNGDVCYDTNIGPCTGTINQHYFDLENHTRNDSNAYGSYWGDNVEGRVAGTLLDLMDSQNESPWYDSAYWGFDPIADNALMGSGKTSLQQFWDAYLGTDKHNGVRSIYQNTVDYDQAPAINSIPDHRILQNFSYSHAINLWNFSSDFESEDSLLTYQLLSVSDSRCGISLDAHWVDIHPQAGWIGSCNATVQISDSIKSDFDSFQVFILPITNRIFLPIAMK